MAKPGDLVTVDFPGTQGIKRRPAVVISSSAYHDARPDVILGSATTPMDYVLQDWRAAGLHSASAFRCFLATMPAASITTIGRLSDRDWQGVQALLRLAIA
jgi:mRNA interferase MazF